jgi:hypothetical protein
MVESNETIFGKHRAFTASQQNMVIQGAKSKYLEGLTISINGLQDGGSAPTTINELGLVNPISVDVGGVTQVNIRLEDLYAFNKLVLGNNPIVKQGAGDNQEWIISGLYLPLWFPATNEETKVSATFGAVTNADNTELSLSAHYLDNTARRETMYYQEFQKNTSGVDNENNWNQDIDLIGNCTGVLIRTSTVQGGSVLIENGTIQEVAIEVNGQRVQTWEWSEISALPKVFTGQSYDSLMDSPDSTAILDNYRYLPIQKEPIQAGNKMTIKIKAGVDAEAVRTLAIQQIQF